MREGHLLSLQSTHFSRLDPCKAVGSSMLGTLRVVARPQDSHFPITGVTQSLCLTWWPFLFYDHPPLVSLRKRSLILITRSQAEGTRGLGLGLDLGYEDSFTSDLGQALSTLPTLFSFWKRKQTLPLACLNTAFLLPVSVQSPVVLKMTILVMSQILYKMLTQTP